MEFCRSLPGFREEDYTYVQRAVRDGDYIYNPVDHVLTNADGWKVKIEDDGRFISVVDS
jgi:hypothetical protein